MFSNVSTMDVLQLQLFDHSLLLDESMCACLASLKG